LIELTAANALDYLQRSPSDGWRVAELPGGVSNTVLLVEGPGERFVLKQALAKLRVAQEWFSRRDRIRLEYGILERLAPRMPAGSLPCVLFTDPDNFLFAMSAAPTDAETWKAQLLRGQADAAIAAQVGEMLGGLIRAGREEEGLRQEFADQTVFDELRLDPYYRATAARHPDLAGFFEARIEACRKPYSLVHGDWSPKNFLVAGNSVMAIDWEVIHTGDPSFDAAFCTNHLLLKSFRRPEWREHYRCAGAAFWGALRAALPEDALPWFEASAIRHLGGLMLARVDGKSPVEYLDAAQQARVRSFARALIAEPLDTIEKTFDATNPA
jgi:5-methylthioribose kinase